MKAITIACWAAFAVAVVVTVVFFSWYGLKDRLVFGDQKFDQVQWITARETPEQRCYRGAMAFDLQQHYLLKGMPKQAVMALLGRPSWEDATTPQTNIEYDLGYCLWDVHGLRVFFDDQGKLVHSKISQH